MTDKLRSDWDPQSESVLRDQRAAYDNMREQCPVAYNEAVQWSLFRHRDLIRVLHDHDTFSSVVSQHLSIPNGMDPPEHTIYRQIIEPYFAPARMEAFEPSCREIITELLDQIPAQNDVELMADIAQPFAVQVQCAFLGWPPSLHDPLVQWARKNTEATRAGDRAAMSDIARELETLVVDMLEVRRQAGAKPGDDITADLMHEEIWGRRLNNEEMTSILRNWTVGEIGTISAAIGILVHYLAKHIEVQKRLREQPSLLPGAIDEILRIHGPLVTNRRITTCPVEMGGRKMGAGERISLNWISANRDSNVFDSPDSFRLDRDPTENLLYGAGIHVCPGAPLARMELLTVMEALFKHTEWIEPVAGKPAINAVYPASGFSSLPLRFKTA